MRSKVTSRVSRRKPTQKKEVNGVSSILQPVPLSKADVFNSTVLKFNEKGALMRLLRTVVDTLSAIQQQEAKEKAEMEAKFQAKLKAMQKRRREAKRKLPILDEDSPREKTNFKADDNDNNNNK